MMDGLITADLLKGFSGWTLAGALFLLLALGRLVPLRTVRREQALLEREAAAWKAAHDTEAEQLGLVLTELRKLVPPVSAQVSPAAPPIPPSPARREVGSS